MERDGASIKRSNNPDYWDDRKVTANLRDHYSEEINQSAKP